MCILDLIRFFHHLSFNVYNVSYVTKYYKYKLVENIQFVFTDDKPYQPYHHIPLP